MLNTSNYVIMIRLLVVELILGLRNTISWFKSVKFGSRDITMVTGIQWIEWSTCTLGDLTSKPLEGKVAPKTIFLVESVKLPVRTVTGGDSNPTGVRKLVVDLRHNPQATKCLQKIFLSVVKLRVRTIIGGDPNQAKKRST